MSCSNEFKINISMIHDLNNQIYSQDVAANVMFSLECEISSVLESSLRFVS